MYRIRTTAFDDAHRGRIARHIRGLDRLPRGDFDGPCARHSIWAFGLAKFRTLA